MITIIRYLKDTGHESTIKMNMYMIVHVLLVQSWKESKGAFLLHSDVLKWVHEQGLWYTLGLIGRKWVELQEL